jgi:adenine-specific DNA methylase
LDPFAGGGAIPLEALRLGCVAHAVDLNPVAHLIEVCTLVYPQKYGQPDSRPVPEYIKRLIAHNRVMEGTEDGTGLFDGKKDGGAVTGDDLIPDVEITEAEYRKNPLAADVKYWGHLILASAKKELGRFYPEVSDRKPVAYVWARTVPSPDPTIKADVPLVSSLWLSKKSKNEVALRLVPNSKTGKCDFEVVHGKEINFDADLGTVRRGQLQCPFSNVVMKGDDIRLASRVGRMGQQLIAVIESCSNEKGKRFRAAAPADMATYDDAALVARDLGTAIPNEPITEDRPSPNSRGLSAVSRYGIDDFGKLFNARQIVSLCKIATLVRDVNALIKKHHDDHYSLAVTDLLGCSFSRLVDQSSTLVRWLPQLQAVASTFGRQALAMTWDYVEAVPISAGGGGLASGIEWVFRVIVEQAKSSAANVRCVRGTATALSFEDSSIDGIVTDPPYYDAVPYSDLSDFFYVWLKRAVGAFHGDLFRTPLTPKSQELIAYYGSGKRKVNKPPEWYESNIEIAFREMKRVLRNDGICAVMFAHKTALPFLTAKPSECGVFSLVLIV